jgi:preprotein translocase subunit YajC
MHSIVIYVCFFLSMLFLRIKEKEKKKKKKKGKKRNLPTMG